MVVSFRNASRMATTQPLSRRVKMRSIPARASAAAASRTNPPARFDSMVPGSPDLCALPLAEQRKTQPIIEGPPFHKAWNDFAAVAQTEPFQQRKHPQCGPEVEVPKPRFLTLARRNAVAFLIGFHSFPK